MYKYQHVKDNKYFEGVMGNFSAQEQVNSVVQFGEMGKGVHPNYQIKNEVGATRCYNGQNHEEYFDDSISDFKPENLAPALTYVALIEQLARCMGKEFPKR